MRNIRVLVIDDDQAEREELETIIGCAFTAEPNGTEIRWELEAPRVALRNGIETVLQRLVRPAQQGRTDTLPDLVVLDWKLRGQLHHEYQDIKSGIDIYSQLIAPVVSSLRCL